MKFLSLRGAILFVFTVHILAICQPIWAVTCGKLFLKFKKHRVKVAVTELNETDAALWDASGKGNKEVGVIELLDSNGRIIDATDFVYQKSSGDIIQREIYVPIKETFTQLLDRISENDSVSAVRFTHVHPKTLTEEGVLHIGANWIFSPRDKQAAYMMKFMLEQANLPHLSLEMHLVYQPPFAKNPRKKHYNISNEFTWTENHYSLGRANDQRIESMLGIRRSN